MTNSHWTFRHLNFRWTRIAAAALLGLAVAASAGTTPTLANDDENEAADTRFLRNFLTGLGLRRDGTGPEYRERSPLVVPPSRDLPSPEKQSITEKTPAWPNDPDVKRAREAKAAARKPRKTQEEESMPLLPNQLGAPASRSAPASQRPVGEAGKDPEAPSSAWDLKAKSFFTMDALMGSKKETMTFTREPTRSSLTEPPPGYRTPSPAQPYGIGAPTKQDAINPMDSPQVRGMN